MNNYESLNRKVAAILKQHPEGEDFFDALDATIRSDQSILESFKDFFYKKVADKSSTGVILTGQFGQAFISNFGEELEEDFADVIVVNGGIRTGSPVNIFRDKLKAARYILLDDSFYSGKTRDAIAAALKFIHSQASITNTYVIYDGSKDKKYNVFSMFRYY